MGSPLLEVNQKPAVLLTVLGRVPEEFVLALEYGLEEEGIPCQRQEEDSEDAIAAASRGARASRINVGLGICSGNQARAVLHHRDLAEAQPLFSLAGQEISVESLYSLGRNAARLVKGNPFILSGRPEERQGNTRV